MVRIIRMRSQSVLVGMVLWEEVRRKRSQALIPSLCGILVYNDETSSVTSKELAGKLLMVREFVKKVVSVLNKGWQFMN